MPPDNYVAPPNFYWHPGVILPQQKPASVKKKEEPENENQSFVLITPDGVFGETTVADKKKAAAVKPENVKQKAVVKKQEELKTSAKEKEDLKKD
ncbi:hypothetical protein Dip510_001061 [Elusimicrobium posterum]|uniref:hypothetical protein n=1 Tax=Elusimicrobium posterum TaxID=3116653 RepID=UPI003C71D65F